MLKEAEAGLKPAEVCGKYGISEATYYNWKSKFDRMTVSETRRLKNLEQEQQAEALAGRIGARQRGAERPAVSKAASPQAKREAVRTLMTERATGIT
ncbi:transposase [Burkholderia ubonensis]|uniref:transposase n=1 Tax=Burkholderia ubonensis TaxID=101571 RepID=UPI000AB76A09|nr:transposase [Burkholderia ubonensis]